MQYIWARRVLVPLSALGMVLLLGVTGVSGVRAQNEPGPADDSALIAPPEVAPPSTNATPLAPPPAPSPEKKPSPAPNPAATAYKGLFFNNDFRYLDLPEHSPRYLGDYFKRLPLGQHAVMDLGGEYRLRHHYERNLRGSNLSGLDDNFLLERTRLYMDVDTGDFFRFYVEAIDALSHWENETPRTIEENRFDALNLFGDALLSEIGEGELWIRGGRQELLYGDQRLISPLDWSNTRRTFDGMNLFYRHADWDVDAFWTRPVPFSQHVNSDRNFDHPNLDQEFLGLYSVYQGAENQTWDLYFRRLADYSPANFDANLFGGRWRASREAWQLEVEGGYQYGRADERAQSAGFATAGLGYQLEEVCWKPTLWAYYDWASGGDADGDKARTFNQLFPLGHKYLGYADLVARQNIRDLNFLLTAKPTAKTNLLLWWHIFELDDPRDALYNAAGARIRSDPTGQAGRDVGQELDVTIQYVFSPRMDVLFGYSRFWQGDFVRQTNPVGVSGNVDFVYTQASWKF